MLASTASGEVDIFYDPQPEYGIPSRGDTSKKDWHEDHGTISKILGDSVVRIRFRYFSQKWKDADDVRAYVKDVLTDTNSKTYTAPVWDSVLNTDVECIIYFRNGKHGVWLLQGWTSCFQDSSGKYWFATHMQKRKEEHNGQGIASSERSEP